MIAPYQQKASTGTKKAIGQLKKVLSMIENGDYCMHILQQVRAVEGLLAGVSAQVIESHLYTCGQKVFQDNDKKEHEKIIKELLIAFKASKN